MRALDFLVDMLNDEIDEVRVIAMLCFRKVCLVDAPFIVLAA